LQENLALKWREYLQEQLPIPGGTRNVGKYWNYEKTPSSILRREVASWVNIVTPSVKLVVMIRNPAPRALSAFVMYTRHVNDYNEFSATWDLDKVMYSSLVVRHVVTGQVRFAKSGGQGGEVATAAQMKHSEKDPGPWRYVAFPPSAQDFHAFLMTSKNISDRHGQFHYSSRESRVVQEGFYARYLQAWLEVFPAQQLLVVPMEDLWNARTIENLNTLQRRLRVPVFDYRKVTYVDKDTKRYELKSASTYFLWKMFNTGDSAVKMLPESRQYLDDLYCQSNRDLARMLPGTDLKGYACV
jgi:hypothetical protein